MAGDRERSTLDLETDAIVDLVARMRHLRRRVALPFVVVAAAFSNLGAAAHATGYWAVLGVLPDNTYVVNKLTVILAFLLPILPVAIFGVPVYAALRSRTRRAWREEHGEHGLSAEWLSTTSARFP